MNTSEKITLTELQFIIRDSLYIALPEMYWVAAEISEIRENFSGHCYLELIEKQHDEKNIKARIKAIIWSSRYRFLKSYFENITGETLKEGLKILAKVKIEYHELYGLSLIISDIDPAFTIGEMAAKRQMIIARLEQEGVFSMNKELILPAVPRRVAVVSSSNAAGYSDFMKQLHENSYGYKYYTALFETVMQGTETEESVINSLNRIADNIEYFDVVVLIRGGGSQTDLSWFDNYRIAYHVTQFPIPLITGIGHERDMTVTDMVAFQSCKTPTSVADFLIGCVADTETHLTELSRNITELSRVIIERNRNRLELSRLRLIPVSRIMISEAKENLSGKIVEIINTGKDFIIRAGFTPLNQKSRLTSLVRTYSLDKDTMLKRTIHDLKLFAGKAIEKNNNNLNRMESSVIMLDPANVLKRGYTVTMKNGKILKSCESIETDDAIDTRFSDGHVISRVEMTGKETTKL